MRPRRILDNDPKHLLHFLMVFGLSLNPSQSLQSLTPPPKPLLLEQVDRYPQSCRHAQNGARNQQPPTFLKSRRARPADLLLGLTTKTAVGLHLLSHPLPTKPHLRPTDVCPTPISPMRQLSVHHTPVTMPTQPLERAHSGSKLSREQTVKTAPSGSTAQTVWHKHFATWSLQNFGRTRLVAASFHQRPTLAWHLDGAPPDPSFFVLRLQHLANLVRRTTGAG